MQAYGRDQRLIEPEPGGCGLFRVGNRKWTPPANRPLAFEPSLKQAQTFKPIEASVPKGCRHNPLSFRRRFKAPKRWLRLLRAHTPRFGLERSTHRAKRLRLKTLIQRSRNPLRCFRSGQRNALSAGVISEDPKVEFCLRSRTLVHAGEGMWRDQTLPSFQVTLRNTVSRVKKKGPQERGDGKYLFSASRLSVSILPRRRSE
jgi:hypothetical protein